CIRYSCRVLKGIKVGPAPGWMVARLESCGIRSINNVVDATNYIMLETGQPLHAFDLKQIRGGKVSIRRAKKGEVMKTLDGQERKLEKEDLVIADAKRILALAGVMGGEDSGVEEDTVDLLLESACFQGAAVRKTARRLALSTESSYRFERGVDPNGCVSVLDRLTDVLLETAGGQMIGPVTDAYPNPVLPPELELRSSQIKRILGIELEAKDITEPLKGLGIEGSESITGSYRFKVPTFRSDLTREIDLIEELVRLYGYNNIPHTYPKISLQEILPPTVNTFDRLDQLRNLLMGWGFNEVLHYSFTSPDLLEKFGSKHLEKQTLKNPISEELSVMRPALFPQMVQTLQNNVFKGNKDLKLFEVRPVYLPNGKDGRPAREEWHLCLGMSGARRPLHFLEKDELSDMEEFQGLTLLDLKGYLQSLVWEWIPGAHLTEAPLQRSYFHPKRQLGLQIGLPEDPKKPREIGFLGRLHPGLLSQMDVPVPIILAEINLELFLTEWKNSIQFQEISPFPTVWRDLNLIVDEATPSGQVLGVIRSQGGNWLKRAELYDVYRGKPLPEGKKALTYRIEYGAPDRTLRDEEVNEAREKLLAQLKTAIGATLR
ncbi:MAG: phenylalanine--tRNA ligase subunit beta, partial [bacterium]|nr:phenylalanine--tRNA ligase subunit beta [bacterium]